MAEPSTCCFGPIRRYQLFSWLILNQSLSSANQAYIWKLIVILALHWPSEWAGFPMFTCDGDHFLTDQRLIGDFHTTDHTLVSWSRSWEKGQVQQTLITQRWERLLEDIEFLGIVKLPSTASMFTRILTEKRPSGWTKTPSSVMFGTLALLQSRTEMSGFGLHPLDLHITKSWLAAVLQTRKLTSDPWTTHKQ